MLRCEGCVVWVVECIGIKTAAEAKQISKKFSQKVKERNKKAVTRRNILVISILITAALTVWAARAVFYLKVATILPLQIAQAIKR